MKRNISFLIVFNFLLLPFVLPVRVQAAQHIGINAPAGSERFGQQVAALPNGNIVVTDPLYDAPGPVANVGAVYLYNGATQALISTLTGSAADDRVGSGGVTVLSNGNFVIASPQWGSSDVGAVTWGSRTIGIAGVVSVSNSLIGSTPNDLAGNRGVTTLPNGNYVVRSPAWDGAAADVGAVTWGDGTTGVTGAVSDANSLVGSTESDQVGSRGVTVLANANYVVRSPGWHGPGVNTGAATWGSGTTGISGIVSPSNSLVGFRAGDLVGDWDVIALPNGNYVVLTPTALGGSGAVTWGDGVSGVAGVVSQFNSLVGTTDDHVGSGGVTILTNGNYVVCSPEWNFNAGAITWGSGTTGARDYVSFFNSFLGAFSDDQLCIGGVTALTNGNYVVSSPLWGETNVGAVTWFNGTSATLGGVSVTNSLIGSSPNDFVGIGGTTALANGNYVVSSTHWGASDIGAVTWRDGTIPTSGIVAAATSLTGSSAGDGVGSVDALPNGNYVVRSPAWDGAVGNVGAVTWANGTAGLSGIVSVSNSLVGSTAGDAVGERLTVLTNGNYVVRSGNWDGAATDVGAVTWASSTSGIAGVVSAVNSLVGSTANDRVGHNGVSALPNGNYVVSSSLWGASDLGAVTWGSGTSGVVGVVSASNSLVGSTAGDLVGGSPISHLTDGSYIIHNPLWDNEDYVNAGSISYGNGIGGTFGVLSTNNSVLGIAPNGGSGLVFSIDMANNQIVVGRPFDNIVTLFRPTGPTAAHVSISGRVMTADGRGLRNAVVTLTDRDGNSRDAFTSAFGYYRIEGVTAGETYVLTVRGKPYHFSPRIVSVLDDLDEIDFIAAE